MANKATKAMYYPIGAVFLATNININSNIYSPLPTNEKNTCYVLQCNVSSLPTWVLPPYKVFSDT